MSFRKIGEACEGTFIVQAFVDKPDDPTDAGEFLAMLRITPAIIASAEQLQTWLPELPQPQHELSTPGASLFRIWIDDEVAASNPDATAYLLSALPMIAAQLDGFENGNYIPS